MPVASFPVQAHPWMRICSACHAPPRRGPRFDEREAAMPADSPDPPRELPDPRAHAASLDQIGEIQHAIDTNDAARVSP